MMNIKSNKHSLWYHLISVMILLIFAACNVLPNVEDPTTLNIAVIGPFSGDISALGQSMRNGVVIAAEEKNAAGGLLGQRVQLLLLDSQCDITIARSVTLEAIRDAGAEYIIGGVCGAAAEGIAQVASEQGVVYITPASLNDDLTFDNNGDVRPYVFRVPFTDQDQGKVAGYYAREVLEAESASVLVAQDSIYETTLANAFTQVFEAAGGEILLRESYDRAAETFYDAFVELRDVNADLIYIPGYYNVINQLVPQARIYGIHQVIIGSDGWNSPDLNVASLEGCIYTAHFSTGQPSPAIMEWVQKYENRYLMAPDTVATLSYDAAMVLFSAIEKAETTAPANVAQAMNGMAFDTLLGELSFDNEHNPLKSILIIRIQNAKLVYDTQVKVSAVEER
ncbi:MAG: ABC transporter substrate-binding protein [Anaerolineae bacterium]|nr:ABC transporter substrate-binding protein [Anaerolineae bacterium]